MLALSVDDRPSEAGASLDEPAGPPATLIDATQLAVRAASNRAADPALSRRLRAV